MCNNHLNYSRLLFAKSSNDKTARISKIYATEYRIFIRICKLSPRESLTTASRSRRLWLTTVIEIMALLCVLLVCCKGNRLSRASNTKRKTKAYVRCLFFFCCVNVLNHVRYLKRWRRQSFHIRIRHVVNSGRGFLNDRSKRIWTHFSGNYFSNRPVHVLSYL